MITLQDTFTDLLRVGGDEEQLEQADPWHRSLQGHKCRQVSQINSQILRQYSRICRRPDFRAARPGPFRGPSIIICQ